MIAVAGNVAAKVFEFCDQPIYALGGIVSGHTLKHLSAGLAFLPLAFLLRRIGKDRMVDDSLRPDLAAGHSSPGWLKPQKKLSRLNCRHEMPVTTPLPLHGT